MTRRVGVIGAGVMGADHARILDGQVSGAAVTHVSDLDAERAGAVAATLRGARAGDDPLRLIDDPEVDAVLVASSDHTHVPLVRAAVRAGKPVLCEKPLAPDLADARALHDDLRRQGASALVSLGFMRRFDPGYRALRDHLRSGGIGAALVVHCISRGVSAGPATTSEYSVTGASVHEFDIVPWLLGWPVREVSWQRPRTSSRVSGMVDPQVILLRTEDGALTTIETFLNARYGYDVRCEVVGETGAASLVPTTHLSLDSGGARATPYAADWRPRFADAYRLQGQAWVDSLRAGRASPLASVTDGLVASQVSAAVLDSMNDGGAWVEVPDLGPVGHLS
jgi:myo-inositol 2-dehydrogenase/D-chiro-inositol 1-dehydrogenase